MPCLGFPFIAYSEHQEKDNQEKDNQEQTELQDHTQVLTETEAPVGTIPRDHLVTTMDLQLGLAPEHQEKFHP